MCSSLNSSISHWISQCCLLLAWPSHQRVNASALVCCACAARHFELWSEQINGPCGALQMSRSVSFHLWRINIISNIYRTLHIVLSRKIIIAIINVIELSPSPIYIYYIYIYIYISASHRILWDLWRQVTSHINLHIYDVIASSLLSDEFGTSDFLLYELSHTVIQTECPIKLLTFTYFCCHT